MKNWDHSIHQHVLVYQGKDIRIILLYFCRSNKKVYRFCLFFFGSPCIYLYICKSTLVEVNLKPPFLIAIALRYWGWCYFFPLIIPITLDLYLLMLSIKQRGIKYHFLSLWYESTWDWTLVSWTSGEHSNDYANGLVHIYLIFFKGINPNVILTSHGKKERKTDQKFLACEVIGFMDFQKYWWLLGFNASGMV